MRRLGAKMLDVLQGASIATSRTAPLLPTAIGLLTGIVFDQSVAPRAWVYVIVLLTATALAVIRSARLTAGVLLVALAAFCAGGLLHVAAARTIPVTSIQRYVQDRGTIVHLTGTVVSEPRVVQTDSSHPMRRWLRRPERTHFLLEVDAIRGDLGDIPSTGFVSATVAEPVLDLRKNERIEATGVLRRLRPSANPGSFDWYAYQRRQGICAGFRIKHREGLSRIGETTNNIVTRAITLLRRKVREMLTQDLLLSGPEEASLLEAMVAGHRSRLDRKLNDVFIRAGCVHFLAVSGVHVVIVMFIARFLCRILTLNIRATLWVMAVTVVVYALIVEPRPPILRATILALAYCFSRLIGRERTCLNWIAAAAIVLGVIDPEMVFELGYQLSFAAVLGVSYLSPALNCVAASLRGTIQRTILRRPSLVELIEPTNVLSHNSAGPRAGLLRWANRLARSIAMLLTVSLGAWLCGLPIVACYFERMHPWSAFNSVLIFPLVTVVMALGFARLFTGIISPTLAALLAWPQSASDSALMKVVENLAALPGSSLTVSSPPIWLIISYYLFLILFALQFRPLADPSLAGRWMSKPAIPKKTERRTRPRLLTYACSLSIIWLIGGAFVWARPDPPDGRLRVTVLSVGSGSATVIELPDGKVVLSDAGTDGSYDVGRNTIVPFLRHRGIAQIERVYVSHPNLDHYSGLLSVAAEIPIASVSVNAYFPARCLPGSACAHLLSELAKRGIPLEIHGPPVTTWTLGGAKFEMLHPLVENDTSLKTNDTATVLRISHAGKSILLTGDIEDRGQRMLMEKGDIRASVLVLPHHGSVRPSTGDFIEAVGARVLIRSSGERMVETYNGLPQLAGSKSIHNTADLGAVSVVIDENGSCAHTAYAPRP